MRQQNMHVLFAWTERPFPKSSRQVYTSCENARSTRVSATIIVVVFFCHYSLINKTDKNSRASHHHPPLMVFWLADPLLETTPLTCIAVAYLTRQPMSPKTCGLYKAQSGPPPLYCIVLYYIVPNPTNLTWPQMNPSLVIASFICLTTIGSLDHPTSPATWAPYKVHPPCPLHHPPPVTAGWVDPSFWSSRLICMTMSGSLD